MKSKLNVKTLIHLCTVSIAVIFSAQVCATILIFEAGLNDGQTIPGTYGDRVNSVSDGVFNYGVGSELFTPNIVASYGPDSNDVDFWSTGYGDLSGVIYREDERFGILALTLTADPGFGVSLLGFDLASYGGDNNAINSVTVFDENNSILFFEKDVFVLGADSHTDIDFIDPIAGNSLTVQIDSANLGQFSDRIGLDNVLFGQFELEANNIDEPGVPILFAVGLLSVFRLRKRSHIKAQIGSYIAG